MKQPGESFKSHVFGEPTMNRLYQKFSCLLTLGFCLAGTSTALAQWSTDDNDKKPAASEKSSQDGKKNEESSSVKTKTSRKVIRTKKKTWFEEMGTSLIFSADIGILSGFPAISLTNYQSKFGLAVEGKAMGSILLDKFMIDAGLGWWFYNVSGVEPVFENGAKVVTTDGAVVTDDVSIKLSGSLLDFSPSYRFNKSWFAGPSLQLRYPSDLGYNSQIEGKALGIYAGAQAGYQIFDDDLNTRFVGRFMMPVNYKNWLGFYTSLGVQVGLPISQPETLTIQETTVKTTEKRIVEYKKQFYKFKITRDLVKLVLDNLIVFYPEPGFPTITTESQSFLIDLSQSLAEAEKNWGTLLIETVSRDHAQVIRDSLVSAGMPENKVRLGPVVQGDATSANPPVEFTFKGVKNQPQMMDAVRRAMQTLAIPETCADGTCN
ncbi:MAG: hypothetical protein RI953_1316 [Pseudomonadota bacterium]|jgi:hypothetical protein